MVAKSYQSLKIVGEPFTKGKKDYVKVETAGGALKEVRWYTPEEYKNYYGELLNDEVDPLMKGQKQVLGFEKGYITIFKGNTYGNKEWFKSIGAVYRKFWGWGLASTLELPEDLPADITPIQLPWDLVGTDKEVLKSDEEVQAGVASLIEDPSSSEFVGNLGDRITVVLTVKKAIHMDGMYGMTTMHVMEDDKENVYIWSTSARDWAEGTVHTVTGTIKEHKMYKNVKQTILTRCKEK